ncbi:MAG: metallophosphoesterase [Lachnospiraceae bacterium]|nr:metallophosphoesterase [Lachnospiraceae bacterium]
MKRSSLFFLGTAAVAIGATIYQLAEHGVPVRREYDAEVPEGLSGLRILMLSDLHCNPLICNNARVLRQLKKEAPDVILLAGDMISKYGKKENRRVPAFLKKLTEIAPVVYGMGNHEERLRAYFPEQFEAYRNTVEDMGISFLDNETVSLVLRGKNIEFAGLTLKHEYYYKRKRQELPLRATEELFIEHPESTVLLAHFPDHFPAYAKLAPLVVSGHNHGGIIRLPVVGGLISPQLYLPPYTRGCYKEGDSTMVVSAGIGSHSLPARLFNRIEYCIINTKTRK